MFSGDRGPRALHVSRACSLQKLLKAARCAEGAYCREVAGGVFPRRFIVSSVLKKSLGGMRGLLIKSVTGPPLGLVKLQIFPKGITVPGEKYLTNFASSAKCLAGFLDDKMHLWEPGHSPCA